MKAQHRESAQFQEHNLTLFVFSKWNFFFFFFFDSVNENNQNNKLLTQFEKPNSFCVFLHFIFSTSQKNIKLNLVLFKKKNEFQSPSTITQRKYYVKFCLFKFLSFQGLQMKQKWKITLKLFASSFSLSDISSKTE